MAKTRHYGVAYVFPVKDKDGKIQRITPRRTEEIEDLMTPAQIKDHLAAGNLIDNGAANTEAASAKGGK